MEAASHAHEHHHHELPTSGYSLTSLPLLRAGLALSAVVPIALATDTFSIAVMEIVDNAIIVIVPGAMESGAGDILFWGALSFALVVAGVVAFPVNRWLITRGRGHAVLHNSRASGGGRSRATASRSRPSASSAPAATSSRCAKATSPTSTPTRPNTTASRSPSRRSSLREPLPPVLPVQASGAGPDRRLHTLVTG